MAIWTNQATENNHSTLTPAVKKFSDGTPLKSVGWICESLRFEIAAVSDEKDYI
jgi:hypothetical protein